jgi:LysR family nitrogen assimilation transcriptional regulator
VNLRQLRYFAAVYEQASQKDAARLTGISPSTGNVHLSRLEQEFGCKLFKSTRHGLVPRPVADLLYPTALDLEQELRFIARYLQKGYSETPSQLVLGSDAFVPGSLLAAAVLNVAAAVETRNGTCRVRVFDAEPSENAGADELRVSFRVGEVPQGASLMHIARDRWVLLNIPDDVLRARPLKALSTPERPIANDSVAEVLKLLDCLSEHEQLMPLRTANLIDDDDRNVRRYRIMPLSIVPQALLGSRIPLSLVPSSARDPYVYCALPTTNGVSKALHSEVVRRLRAALTTMSPPTREISRRLDPRFAARLARHVEQLRRPVPAILELKALRYFAAIYDEGHVGRAAAKLGVVQPALSMQLRKLEDLLGGRLFERHAHGMASTPRGERLHHFATPVLRTLGAVQGGIQRHARSANGDHMRIGVIPALDEYSLLASTLAATAARWSEAFPAVALKIVEAYSDQLCSWVQNEMLDCAIVNKQARQRGLSAETISSEAFVVVSQPAHRLLPTGPVQLADAAKLPLVLPSSRHAIRILVDQALATSGHAAIPRVEIDSMASLIGLVKSGRWATLMPVSAVYKHRLKRDLQLNEIVEPRVLRSLSVVYRTRQPLTARERRFIAMFAGTLNSAMRGMPAFSRVEYHDIV